MAPKIKQQHLTIFLIKAAITVFEDALRPDSGVGNPIPLANQDFAGVLYLPEPNERPPSWFPFVQAGFPGAADVVNQSTSALVLLLIDGRIFALTFGHGRYFLNADCFERDFGLRVVVNRVNKEKIRGIKLRTLKDTQVKRQEEASKGTRLAAFEISTHQDLLRGVWGAPDDKSLGARLSGSDSLAIDIAIEFSGISALCSSLLVAYASQDYKSRGFDWIDNLVPVRSPSQIDSLNEKLLGALKRRSNSIQMVYPEYVDSNITSGFMFEGEDLGATLRTEPDVDDWRAHVGPDLKSLSLEDFRSRKTSIFDTSGTQIAEVPELQFFTFETSVGRTKFVLSGGEWFEVARSFAQRIDTFIKSISIEHLPLPPFDPAWDEDRYVAEAAKEADLMSMHKKTMSVQGTAVEPCDLLHRSGALIHVKNWSASATFSQLLAQGAVSAETLLAVPKFRTHVASSASKHVQEVQRLFPIDDFSPSSLHVVWALMRETKKQLPFFSRLNMMREGERIRRLGYGLSYQQIKVA